MGQLRQMPCSHVPMLQLLRYSYITPTRDASAPSRLVTVNRSMGDITNLYPIATCSRTVRGYDDVKEYYACVS